MEYDQNEDVYVVTEGESKECTSSENVNRGWLGTFWLWESGSRLENYYSPT